MTDVRLTDHPVFGFINTFTRELPELATAWQPAAAPAPQLLALNADLAEQLGLAAHHLRTPEGVAVLAGNVVPEGAASVAMVYSGHQFGGYSPRLGDGRALLLGEVLDVHGRRRDLHFKGSGRTPFARGGDGKAAVGPMLREYLIGEAMHALGVPTTRALAVVGTGEQVVRERLLPGAVLTRVASSHIRVGTFQYVAATGNVDLLARLAGYSIERHHPAAATADNPPLALLEAVIEAQAALIAKWMHVGFVHGVMNTDNMTISGETIDYGPCAFMDRHDPSTVFSSIDQFGRYAYGNQPRIALWNLARLAEALLPLVDADTDAAVAQVTERLHTFLPRYEQHWLHGMRAKLGLAQQHDDDKALCDDLLVLMTEAQLDHTGTFRSLSAMLRGELLHASLAEWADRWLHRLDDEGRERAAVAGEMDAVNPIYIPRNHLVEAALSAATDGDMTLFQQLVDVVTQPHAERPGLEEFALPAPADSGRYVTFCGT